MNPENAAENLNRALEKYANTPVEYTVMGSLFIEHSWITAAVIMAVIAVLSIVVFRVRSNQNSNNRSSSALKRGIYGAAAGAVIFAVIVGIGNFSDIFIKSTTDRDQAHNEVMSALTTVTQQRYDVVSVEPAASPDRKTENIEPVARYLTTDHCALVTVTLEDTSREDWTLCYDRERAMVALDVPEGSTVHTYPSEVLTH